MASQRSRPPAKAAAPAVDPRFAPVVAAFAADPRVTGGKMMSSYGLKVNGKIFAMCVRGDLVCKLPKARVEELVAADLGRPFEPRPGRLMKEWVALSGSNEQWPDLAREACRFVSPARK